MSELNIDVRSRNIDDGAKWGERNQESWEEARTWLEAGNLGEIADSTDFPRFHQALVEHL